MTVNKYFREYILPDVGSKYGAPIGRTNYGERPTDKPVHVRRVKMYDYAYDVGGAYWGAPMSINDILYVDFTTDGTYRKFYRAKEGNKPLTSKEIAIMNGGIPKWIRCYDNGGRSIDRYTIVFTKKRVNDEFIYISCNAYPYHPQGIGQHGFSGHLIDRPSYAHLGKKIKYQDLPEDVQHLVAADYRDIWGI